jgi:acyl-coenzyme A thioesterase PaaI-like protein
VRNHLGSVHAIALTNLAEIAGNLALLYSAPDDSRMILTGLSMEYLKKARGHLEAECHCPIPDSNAKREFRLEVPIRDGDGNTVAVGTLRSLLGPR